MHFLKMQCSGRSVLLLSECKKPFAKKNVTIIAVILCVPLTDLTLKTLNSTVSILYVTVTNLATRFVVTLENIKQFPVKVILPNMCKTWLVVLGGSGLEKVSGVLVLNCVLESPQSSPSPQSVNNVSTYL